ncbi:MAG: PEP-CTERM sorting domain-containing protein [Fimbriimonadaceae bacterium]|nr:PEP-CTERM sorting domain-containing protein [Fimbriimonadaceae bacterium]
MAAAGVANGQYLQDFESYDLDTDMEGAAIGGGATLHNSGTGGLLIKGAGAFGGSNPIGDRGLFHNESSYVDLNFATPALYFGAYDIDSSGTDIKVTFSDGSTHVFSTESTGASGDSAEFFGLVAENGLNFTKIQFDGSGVGGWGLDNFEYGVESVPEPASLSVMAVGGLALLRRRKK